MFVAGGLSLGVAWWRWRPFRIEIEGRSMEPVLRPGDWALAVLTRKIRPGDVVVAEHPDRPGYEVVKRIAAGPSDVAPDGRTLGVDELWISGDASDRSTDSREFGPVRAEAVRGRVVVVWWPPARWRWV